MSDGLRHHTVPLIDLAPFLAGGPSERLTVARAIGRACADIGFFTIRQLGDEIEELSVHLDAATVRLLDLIREFDVREGWNNGFRSCAAWLAWRVGLDMGAARERVRVARALEALPLLTKALARGELSYALGAAVRAAAATDPGRRGGQDSS